MRVREIPAIASKYLIVNYLMLLQSFLVDLVEFATKIL